MNEYYTDITSISGVQYYMIEMMQFLKDKYNIQNIKELVNPLTETNRNIVHSRYTYTFDMIETLDTHVDKLFVSMNSLLYLLQSSLYQLLYNVDKIYLLNANSILELFKICIQHDKILIRNYKQISKKIFLLHEYGFENDFYQKCNLKIIPIVRGLYFKYFKNIDYNSYDKYFMFTTEHNTVQSYTKENLEKAQDYCLEQNIEYSTDYCINPASTYKGLIYFRYHDYMPSLPYEFWYYNKDVRLIQVSDGLQKRLAKYGERIFNWDLLEVF